MIDTVEMYEARPIPVHALQWQGNYRQFDKALRRGEVHRWISTYPGYEFWNDDEVRVYLRLGDWLVLDGHSVRRYTDEQFQKFYRERPITGLADYVTDQLKENGE